MSEDAAVNLPPPALQSLRAFGRYVYDAIGQMPYLVGSVLERREWRDVDVRIMLDDADFAAVFGGDGLWVTNGALKLFNRGLSALAKEMTGLDVDCQFQRTSDANAEYGGQRRNPLAINTSRADPDVTPSPLVRQR